MLEPNTDAILIEQARAAAIQYLTKQGYPKDADYIRRGAGDDFPEVKVAAFALAEQRRRIADLEEALQHYAQHDFWRPDEIGLVPAEADEGRIARAVLKGERLASQIAD